MTQFNREDFKSNFPNIPKIEEFAKNRDAAAEKRKVLQDEFRDLEVIGPILPPITYSDEEDYDEQVSDD